MKIGIYGGSFDPIHEGHVKLAKYVLDHTDLDEVWLMVSPLNPLKPQGYFATDTERLDMARTALEDVIGVRASDFEFSLPMPSYTYHTLCSLKKKYPDYEFKLVIGGDNWASFAKWKNPEEILKEYGVIVYPRPGEKIAKHPAEASILEGAPLMGISSSEIRDLLKSGTKEAEAKLKSMLNPEVLTYIQTHHLYHDATSTSKR